MSEDPYQYRAEDDLATTENEPEEPVVSGKPLHSLWCVFFATVFGSVLGGVTVISVSLFRLQKRRLAWTVFVCGLLFTVVLFVGLFQLPDNVNVPSAALFLPQIFCMHLVAKQLYGQELEQQERAGGRISSGWVGIGVGALSTFAILSTVLGCFIIAEGIPLSALVADYGEELVIGQDAVYYDGEASQADAEKLAKFLTQWEYFGGDGADVRIRYKGHECIISFCLYESSMLDEGTIESFQWLADELVEAGFGPPTKVELCNDQFEPQTTLTGVVREPESKDESDFLGGFLDESQQTAPDSQQEPIH